MSRTTMTIDDAAMLLLEAAKVNSLADFQKLAEDMLQDTSPGEIEAIGELIPEVLRDLLPRKTLH